MANPNSAESKKIAIVGSGISGMSAAYVLHQNHDITLYERNDYIGGHTRTKIVDYRHPNLPDQQIPVDTGFIVFNYRNYHHLTKLFDHLGVDVEESDMTFSSTIAGGEIEWGAKDLNAVFGQRSNLFKPKFWRMILDIFKFNKESLKVLEDDEMMTLGELLDELKMGEYFRSLFILPMGGAIWSCPVETMLSFPAQTFVRFFHNHGLLTINDQPQWFTVTGGSHEYVKKLTASFADKIRLNAGVVSAIRRDGKVEITEINGVKEIYDEVVFACHADEALNILKDADDEEKKILGNFQYQKNHIYLHSDEKQMPIRKQCWASWVYLSNHQTDPTQLSVTYWMNLLQNIDQSYPLFVTLNPIEPIDEDKIFNEHIFEHPVFTKEAIQAQDQLPKIQGKNLAWFCGAYQRYGFHEDGIGSTANMVKLMGESLPWE